MYNPDYHTPLHLGHFCTNLQTTLVSTMDPFPLRTPLTNDQLFAIQFNAFKRQRPSHTCKLLVPTKTEHKLLPGIKRKIVRMRERV
jgi:hypothetical protein